MGDNRKKTDFSDTGSAIFLMRNRSFHKRPIWIIALYHERDQGIENGYDLIEKSRYFPDIRTDQMEQSDFLRKTDEVRWIYPDQC